MSKFINFLIESFFARLGQAIAENLKAIEQRDAWLRANSATVARIKAINALNATYISSKDIYNNHLKEQ